jgi:hypothetical protein
MLSSVFLLQSTSGISISFKIEVAIRYFTGILVYIIMYFKTSNSRFKLLTYVLGSMIFFKITESVYSLSKLG